MPWFTLAWKHSSKAGVLVAALALSLAACLPGANPSVLASTSWNRNPLGSSQAHTLSTLWHPASIEVDDWSAGELGYAHNAGFTRTAARLLPHQPIVIQSDQDFISQGWPGFGTAENPYRIENLEIVASVGNCIDIHSTSAYFSIRGCSLMGSSQGCGVYLKDVANGALENNTCMVGMCGIRFENSESCKVVDNTCRMAVYGIRLSYCQSVNITDNFCETSSATGIRIYESQHIDVVQNQCTGNAYGIEISGGAMNDVSGNTCVSNFAGIVLNTTRMLTANMNECLWNTIGIRLEATSDGTLIQNTCELNTGSGVVVSHSQFNNLVNNLFRGNRHGIELTSAISNYIGGNVFERNAESGIYLYLSQANHVEANTISGSTYGVRVVASNNNVMRINDLVNNTEAGILLVESSMGTINENTFLGSGLELQGESYLAQAEVRDNTVNGAPLAYLQNQRGATVPAGAGQIILLECRNVTIDHQTLSATSIGLLIIYSYIVTVRDCVFSRNTRNGVELWWARAIAFSNNSFVGNGECGLLVHSDCSDNSVRNNLFADNAVCNAVDDGVLNVFDRNFWSDYVGYDFDLDGLGDDPYSIRGQAANHDWNPLMVPPGVSPPAQLPRWVLTVATALIVNALILGIGLQVFRHRRLR